MATDAVARVQRSPLAMALIIARRELHDTLRDWRIMTPIVVLTLIFPWLMNWTAQLAVDFVQRRDATIIGERLIPFLLMIVGFFPASFSLIIALEAFVGEKERRSIEPLLSMPITDEELYLGKMISATALPLVGSVLGISVYLTGLYLSIGYMPSLSLFVQILAMNMVTALLMVSGAVVVSSQTTSVRAANLLASFIIVPTALLIQGESIIMFWGYYDALWAILIALLLVTVIVVRMGMRTFNREEILGREIDELNIKRSLRLLRYHFVQAPAGARLRGPGRGPRLVRWLLRAYRCDVPHLLRRHWMPLAIVAGFMVVAAAIGWNYVQVYPLPAGVLNLQDVGNRDPGALSEVGLLPALTPAAILLHNLRALLLSVLLAVVSLGVAAVLLSMLPIGLAAYLAGQVAVLGYDPLLFVATFVLPHGLFEIPAAAISAAFALRLGASFTAPPEGMTVGESLLAAVAEFSKIFLLVVVPLLLVAAVIEALVTPQLVQLVYGG